MRMKIVSVLVMVIVVGGVSGSRMVQAAPSMVLDGVGRNTTCGETVELQDCAAQLLTTTKGNDVILLVVQCFSHCSLNKSSIIDKSNLTYIQRAYFPNVTYWEYYARTTSPLESDNITVVFSESWTLKMIQVFAIKGASMGIFDPNLPSPVNISCPGYREQQPCSVSIETSTQDFVVASTTINDDVACIVPLGFTVVRDTGHFEVDYLIASKTVGDVLFSCTGTSVVSIVVDAISFQGHA
jgi:hypothetical protein